MVSKAIFVLLPNEKSHYANFDKNVQKVNTRNEFLYVYKRYLSKFPSVSVFVSYVTFYSFYALYEIHRLYILF